MPLWPQFVGGENQARSPNIDLESTINLFIETTPAAENAKKAALYGTAGLKLLQTSTDLVCRGCYSIDSRTFLVLGPTLYEFNTTTNVLTSRGAIANDGAPVSMVSNGRGGEQMIIVGGGQLKVLTLTTNALSAAITLPLTNAPVQADFMDGYFLLTEANTIRFWFSALENGASWPALNFVTRSRVNDNIVGMKVLDDRIWVFGSLTTEVYYNDGTTPFVPYPGSQLQHGAVSAWAITRMEAGSPVGIPITQDALIWLAQDPMGGARMMRSAGGYASVISTPAVSFAWAGYSTITDAEIVAVYEQEGHAMMAITFPTADVTWEWDAREQSWHQHNAWNTTTADYHRWTVRGCCAAGTQIIAGDYAGGQVYQIALDTFTDNGSVIRRLRRAPYLSAENQWLFLDTFELGVQSGVGLVSGQGSAPTLQLRISRDSGHTYGAVTQNAGKIGAYNGRAIWNRLGRVRSDRLVLEVTQTDPVRTVWGPGAWLRATPGSGLL